MPEIKYSILQAKDSEKFYPFFKKIVEEFFYPEYTRKTITYFFEEEYTPEAIKKYASKGNVIVAKDGDDFVGFLLYGHPEGGVSFCNWISVEEKYQGNGIATKLLEMYESDAKKLGAHCILLCTEERNLEFYKKRGYQYMGLNPKGYYGVADYWFFKTIQEAKEENYLRAGQALGGFDNK